MILASFLFACMGVCVKLAAQTLAAAEIVFYRSVISLLLMAVVVRLRGVPLATPHWRWQISRGLSGFLALCCYFLALSLLPLATAVTLNYTSAIFLAIILALFGWRLTTGMIGALLVGLAGVAMLLKPAFHADLLFGGLIGLASGAFAGLAYYNVRELGAKGEPESRTVFYFSLVSSGGAAIWLAFAEMHALGGSEILLLFGVAGFATVAQLAMTRAYARGKTLVAAVLAYSAVIFASFFGVFLFDETLDAGAWLAIVLIVAAGLAATHFSRTAPSEPN